MCGWRGPAAIRRHRGPRPRRVVVCDVHGGTWLVLDAVPGRRRGVASGGRSDEYRSRKERLADLMRRMRICEEKGSGIDKVVAAAERYQLPAPDFRVGVLRTTAVLFAYREFADMGRADRIRACYQHCCLLYVRNRRMSNQSLRERFHLGDAPSASVTASQVIGATKDAGLIRMDATDSNSTRYARYLPFWA